MRIKLPTKLHTIIAVLLCFSTQVKGNYVHGASISWTYLQADSYKVVNTIYRDCNGVDISNIPILFSGNCNGIVRTTSQSMMTPQEVIPLCVGQYSTCSYMSHNVGYGIQKIELTVVIDVSKFKAKGCCQLKISWSACCRASGYTSILSNYNFYIEASLDICQNSPSNSPIYKNDPIFFAWLYKDYFCDFGAYDIDTNSQGLKTDSLYYSFAFPRANDSQYVPWTKTLSPSKPLTYQGFPKTYAKNRHPYGIHLDSTNGQLAFLPTRTEKTQICIKVEEYRNGLKISESIREVGFKVISASVNNPPIISAPNCQNPSLENFKVYACFNSPICFNICTSDKDVNDSTKLTWDKGIKKATFKTTPSKGIKENGSFCWSPTYADISSKPHRFTVFASDNGCPIKGQSSRIFEIYVSDTIPFEIKLEKKALSPSCGIHSLKAYTTDSLKIEDWSIYLHDSILISNKDSFSYTFPKNGSYPIKVTASRLGCSRVLYDTIKITGIIPFKVVPIKDTSLCLNHNISRPFTAIGGLGSKTYNWLDITGLNFGKGSVVSAVYNNPFDSLGEIQQMICVATDSVGCEAKDTFKIWLKHRYEPKLESQISICRDSLDSLSIPLKVDSQQHIASGNWQGVGVQNNRFETKGLTEGKYPIFYVGEDSLNCVSTEADVRVLNKATLHLNNDIRGCPNMAGIQLSAMPPNGIWEGKYISKKGYLQTPPNMPFGDSLFFKYTYTKPNKCISIDSVKLLVLDSLPLVNAGPDTIICSGNQPFELKTHFAQDYWAGNVSKQSGKFFFNQNNAVHKQSYKLVLKAQDAKACYNFDTLNITYFISPKADAGADVELCENSDDSLTFVGKPSKGTWTGDQIQMAETSFSIGTKGLVGEQKFYYTITDSNGCSTSDLVVLQMLPPPTIEFLSKPKLCLSDSVVFYPLRVTPINGQWKGPNITYKDLLAYTKISADSLGAKTFTYSYTNNKGCSAIDTFRLATGKQPRALFSISNEKGLAPFQVNFKNKSENAASFQWDLGDGSTAISKDPSHTYSSPGSFEVMLTATDSTGYCQSTTKRSIQVDRNTIIEKSYNSLVKIYPNPANGTFYMLNKSGDLLHFEIRNQLGQLVLSSQCENKGECQFSILARGTYFIHFYNQHVSAGVKKIVVY